MLFRSPTPATKPTEIASISKPLVVAVQPQLAPVQAIARPPLVEVIKPLATPVPMAISPTKALATPKTETNSAASKARQLVAKSQTKVAVKNSPYTEAERRLLTVPKEHYTIQLGGANSTKHIQTFIKNNRLQDKATFFQTYNNSKTWYVIVYSNYRTKAEAQAALKKLPASVLAQHPWVRRYDEVHAAIQRKLS